MILKTYKLDLFIYGANMELIIESDAPSADALNNYLQKQNEKYLQIKQSIDALKKIDSNLHKNSIDILSDRASNMRINGSHVSIICKRLNVITEVEINYPKILMDKPL